MSDIAIMFSGIAFVIVLIPILQSVSDVAVTLGTWITSIMNCKIVANNAKMESIQNEAEPISNHAIGFDIGSYDDCYEEDCNDEELENKNKIGF